MQVRGPSGACFKLNSTGGDDSHGFISNIRLSAIQAYSRKVHVRLASSESALATTVEHQFHSPHPCGSSGCSWTELWPGAHKYCLCQPMPMQLAAPPICWPRRYPSEATTQSHGCARLCLETYHSYNRSNDQRDCGQGMRGVTDTAKACMPLLPGLITLGIATQQHSQPYSDQA